MMEEKLCPQCGANVEGLLHRCDCCGAQLNPKKTLFSRMTYSTAAFFDIDLYLNQIFNRLDTIPPEPWAEILERIEFDFWCYPIDRKPGVTFHAARKRAIVTIAVDPEEYLYGTEDKKLALLAGAVKENMELLRQRLLKKNIPADELFERVETLLNKI